MELRRQFMSSSSNLPVCSRTREILISVVFCRIRTEVAFKEESHFMLHNSFQKLLQADWFIQWSLKFEPTKGFYIVCTFLLDIPWNDVVASPPQRMRDISAQLTVAGAKTPRCLFNAALAHGRQLSEHGSIILGVCLLCSNTGEPSVWLPLPHLP